MVLYGVVWQACRQLLSFSGENLLSILRLWRLGGITRPSSWPCLSMGHCTGAYGAYSMMLETGMVQHLD